MLLKTGINKVKAASNIEFEGSGLTAENCEIVFELGKRLSSYKPGADLNSLQKITKGKNYSIKVTEEVEVPNL